MFTRRVCVGLIAALAWSAPLYAGDIALIPVGSSDVHEINGNEIELRAGSLVYLEVRISNWDPDLDGTPALKGWQIQLDRSGYTSGTQGHLTYYAPTCTATDECQALLHPASSCDNHIPDQGLVCAPAYFDLERGDYIFAGLTDLPAIDLATPDPRFASVALFGAVVDTAVERYAVTLVLEVSTDARGRFSIGYVDGNNFLLDANDNLIDVNLTPVRIAIIPEPDRLAPKNRYLTIDTSNLGQNRSIRVTFADLPAPFDAYNGLSMWVGQPFPVSTNGHNLGPDIPGFPDFHVGSLQCQKYVGDFSSHGMVEVFGGHVVPGGEYLIDVFDNADPPNLIHRETVQTNRWGDATGLFNGQWLFWEEPDGRVDVITDAVSMLDSFRSLPWAPFKTRVDIQPAVPDQRVTIVDVVYALSAFQGMPYPFDPQPFPCGG